MSNPVLDHFKNEGINALVDKLCEHMDKKQLKRELAESFEQFFKERFENLPMSNEFNIHNLHSFLMRNLDTRVAACFNAGSSKECSYERDSLLKDSYIVAAAATKKQKHGAYAYFIMFLGVIERYFLSNVEGREIFLANRQTNDIIKSVEDLIKTHQVELNAYLERHGSFADYIDSIKSPPQYKSEFHYLNPSIGFVRRDSQFNYLNVFLSVKDPLLSLVVTGPGGIGKSKLLHQYSLELECDLEWKAVILVHSQIKNLCGFKEWKYPKNLLLILDYAAEMPRAIGNWIQAVYKSKSRPGKLRIVMLERHGMVELKDEQVIMPLWYQQLENVLGSVAKEVQYLNGFYELPQLNKSEMLNVIDMLPGAKNALSQKEKEDIYVKIKGFSNDYNDERFNTPLIALILADACMRGRDLNIFDPMLLMDYVIDRNKASWKRSLGKKSKRLFNSLERVVVYATATGGCNLNNLPSSLHKDGQLLIDVLERTGTKCLTALVAEDNKEHDKLLPVKPDIVGEYFVLHYINEKCDSDECHKLIASCWDKPNEFDSFLHRCVRSYLRNFSGLVFDDPPVLFTAAQPTAHANVLLNLLFRQVNIGLILHTA